jgi:uncharacterized membrane protein (DUF2068 family)
MGYLMVVFTFPQVFSPSIKKLGVFMPAIYGLIIAIHFIACVGLWFLKQWGVVLYIIAFFVRILFYMLLQDYTLLFFANVGISIIFIIILLRFFNRMSPNL